MGGLLVNLMWQCAARHRLLGSHLTAGEARRIGRRYVIGPSVYAVATVVGLFLPWLAVVVYAAVNAFYLWPRGVGAVALAPADNHANVERDDDTGSA